MKRILIANRAEIARRVIYTAHAMGIETVAVYAEPDAQALHVREATQAYALGGSTSADSYLRIDKLLAAAAATGADAVHPGYGFLSENAEFAQAVVDAGLCWIGPPPAAIRTLGSKAAAKALAHAQDVPCLPGYAGEDQSDERFQAEAHKLGYPLMVKAVAGGGGRGMRLVQEAGQLLAALRSARSEALAGFGSDQLLIERALLAPRHVEVQVFADQHGHCIHLGERDCSVQRRHQKIVEESPSPAVHAVLRARMGACAVALAQAAGYVGAGTVEFLVEGEQFYLMEMNTRLQVEHPVTEALTGQDLVAWQLRIAQGELLPWSQDEVTLSGHAIEVRLCAEDENFQPHTGEVLHFAAPLAQAFQVVENGLRFDHAIETGSQVSPYYDAMLGKLIVHAPTRAQAIEQMIQALAQTQLLGLPTNRAFLAECLNHPQFRAGQALIPFLATEATAIREALVQKEQAVPEACQLAAVFTLQFNPQGLACPFVRSLRLRHRGAVHALAVRELGHGRLALDTPQGALPVQLLQINQQGALRRVHMDVGGVVHRVGAVSLSPRQWHVQTAGVELWLEDASFEPPVAAGAGHAATELRAPFNGRVVSLSAAAGAPLAAGAVALVLESMKLEHSLCSPADTVVAEVLVEAGQQVSPGQVLLRFASPAAEAGKEHP